MGFLRMDRYIGTAVLMAIGVVLLAFFGLMTIFAMLEELREEDAGYLVSEMFVYVALTTPRRLYEVLPYVVFLGALIGLGSLASRSEIVVFRAAGVSPARIYLSVAWPAALVFALGFFIGEWVAPRSEERAETYKTEAMTERASRRAGRGYWYREGAMNMRVASLGENGELLGIQQFWYDGGRRLERTVEAAWAEYIGGSDPHWILHDVRETRIDAAATVTSRRETERWNGKVDPRVLTIRVLVEPRKLSLEDLFRQIEYMDREGLATDIYRLAYWSKILQPFSVLGLALLALGFILGPLREVGMGVRLSVGVFAGLGFKYLQDLFAPMSMVYELPAALAVSLPIVACWLIGLWGLKRLR
ncbi:MAG: LPS export ABC transporter permease LptG [Pseudomonadota bacterium]